MLGEVVERISHHCLIVPWSIYICWRKLGFLTRKLRIVTGKKSRLPKCVSDSDSPWTFMQMFPIFEFWSIARSSWHFDKQYSGEHWPMVAPFKARELSTCQKTNFCFEIKLADENGTVAWMICYSFQFTLDWISDCCFIVIYDFQSKALRRPLVAILWIRLGLKL